MQFNLFREEMFFWLLILDICSLCHVLSLFQEGESGENDENNTKNKSKKVCRLSFNQSIMIHLMNNPNRKSMIVIFFDNSNE